MSQGGVGHGVDSERAGKPAPEKQGNLKIVRVFSKYHIKIYTLLHLEEERDIDLEGEILGGDKREMKRMGDIVFSLGPSRVPRYVR